MYSIYFHEWPLVFFTCLAQLTAGLSLVLAIYYQKEPTKITILVMQKIGLILGSLMSLALVFSFFHLANVFAGFNIIARLGGNWLPREVVFLGTFATLGLAFYGAVRYNKAKDNMIPIVIRTLPVLALCGLISMGGIYGAMSNTVVSWNFWYAFCIFVSTALVLGGLAFPLLPIDKDKGLKYDLGYRVAIVGLLLQFIIFPLYMIFLGRAEPINIVNLFVIAPLYPAFFFVGASLVVAGYGKMLFVKGISKDNIITILALVVVGELIIRTLFYSLINTHLM